MKRGTLIAIVLGVLLVLGAVALVVSAFLPRSRPDPVRVTFDELVQLDPKPAAVTLRGTAHYRGVVTQNVPPSLAGGPDRYWVYGLFDVHDTAGKEIRILVRSPFEVERRIDYEYVELTGWLDRPKSHTVPPQTEQMFARADYFFSDDVWVLTPWEVESFDPAAEVTE